jgi:hypothetical protein
VAKPDLTSQPPGGELKASQPVDGNDIRVGERADIADDDPSPALVQQLLHLLTEVRDVGPPDRAGDDQNDRARLGGRPLRSHTR